MFSTRCRCCLCSFKWRHRYTQSSKVPLVCTGAFLFACLLFCLRFFLSFFLSIRLKSILCWCNNWKSHSTKSIKHRGAKLHKVYTKIVKLQLEPYDFPSFVLMTTSSNQQSKHIIRTTKEFKFGWTPKKGSVRKMYDLKRGIRTRFNAVCLCVNWTKQLDMVSNRWKTMQRNAAQTHIFDLSYVNWIEWMQV